ncbi:MAG: hypothetical protein K6G81_12490 [Lachnospiraceae bacterium]|nr:hypothetical protein [Lachnospiraceae bacterium]
MKKCPYCRIEVGGNLNKCPLCQSRLTGEGGEAYFPVRDTLKFRSFLYKLQTFIVWSVIVVALGLDFLFSIEIPTYPGLHWSLLIVMWLMVFEYVILRQFVPGTGSARKVTIMVFVILAMLLVTAHYLEFMWLAWDWIVPVVITGAMIANFVLALLDRYGNTMIYLLSGLACVLVPCLIQFFRHVPMSITWTICMIVSVILIVGAVIFKGRAVAAELERRFTL